MKSTRKHMCRDTGMLEAPACKPARPRFDEAEKLTANGEREVIHGSRHMVFRPSATVNHCLKRGKSMGRPRWWAVPARPSGRIPQVILEGIRARNMEPDNLKSRRKDLYISGTRILPNSPRTPAVRTVARLPAGPPEPAVWSPENGGVRQPEGG